MGSLDEKILRRMGNLGNELSTRNSKAFLQVMVNAAEKGDKDAVYVVTEMTKGFLDGFRCPNTKRVIKKPRCK